jgi:hypothetical protein
MEDNLYQWRRSIVEIRNLENYQIFLRKQNVNESLTGKFVKAARIIAIELIKSIFNMSSQIESLKTLKKPGRLLRKICSSDGGGQS